MNMHQNNTGYKAELSLLNKWTTELFF